MTYSTGSSGYQPAQPGQPPGSYGNQSPSFAKTEDTASKLPFYLQVAVVALGLLTYLVSFGPVVAATDSMPAGMSGHIGMTVPLAVFAALLTGAGLLPKAKNYTAVVAMVAVLGALLAIARVITAGDIDLIGWALWVVVALVILQAIAAVGVLLLEAEVITAPTPKPKYDPYTQYGPPSGGGYYGQPGGHHGTGPQPAGQQSAYPSSYGGGYPQAPQGPTTGSFTPPPGAYGTGPQQTHHQGPPTPPTGFPSFGPPPSAGGQPQGQASGDQGQQIQGGQGQQTPSDPSGPAQS